MAQPASEGGALGGACGGFSSLYLESVRQRLAGHKDAAYELLAECLRINPNAQEALFDMARLKLSLSALVDSAFVAEGDSLLRRAYAVDTTNADVREYLARHLLGRGDYEEATHLYERMCSKRQPSYGDLGVLIQLYEIQAQYPQALAAVERMETLEGADAMTAWERFQIYQCMGQRERAMQTYDSLLVKAMPDPTVPEFLKQQMQRQPMYYEKVKSLRTQLLAALDTGDSIQVRDLCRQGEVFEPDFLPYYYYESLSHLTIGDTLQALDACTRAFDNIEPVAAEENSTSPGDRNLAAQIYGIAGDLYSALHNSEAAVEVYEEALKRDTLSLSLLNNYAYQLSLLARDLPQAREMSTVIVEQEPDNVTFLDTHAWVLYQMGEYKEAKKYIDKAYRLADDIDEEMQQHRKAIYEALPKQKTKR